MRKTDEIVLKLIYDKDKSADSHIKRTQQSHIFIDIPINWPIHTARKTNESLKKHTFRIHIFDWRCQTSCQVRHQ